MLKTTNEIDYRVARRFGKSDCSECGGEGWTYDDVAVDDRREVYCACAKENMAEHEAEAMMEDY